MIYTTWYNFHYFKDIFKQSFFIDNVQLFAAYRHIIMIIFLK